MGNYGGVCDLCCKVDRTSPVRKENFPLLG